MHGKRIGLGIKRFDKMNMALLTKMVVKAGHQSWKPHRTGTSRKVSIKKRNWGGKEKLIGYIGFLERSHVSKEHCKEYFYGWSIFWIAQQTRHVFWKDGWTECGRIKDREPMAYNIATKPNSPVKHNYRRGRYRPKLVGINIQQRRAQNAHMREITSRLTHPSDNKDRPLWT